MEIQKNKKQLRKNFRNPKQTSRDRSYYRRALILTIAGCIWLSIHVSLIHHAAGLPSANLNSSAVLPSSSAHSPIYGHERPAAGG